MAAVLQINGVDVAEATHDQAVSLLTAGDRQVTLVLQREHLPANHVPSPAHSPKPPMKLQQHTAAESITAAAAATVAKQAPLEQELVVDQMVVQSGPVLQAPPTFKTDATAKIESSPKLSPPEPSSSMAAGDKQEKKKGKKQKQNKPVVLSAGDATTVVAPPVDASATKSKTDARTAFFASIAPPNAAVSGDVTPSLASSGTSSQQQPSPARRTVLPANGDIATAEHVPRDAAAKPGAKRPQPVPRSGKKQTDPSAAAAAATTGSGSSGGTGPEPYSTEVVHVFTANTS